MPKAIVFDLGGTLMEFAGMPLNWSDYYIGGFEKLNELLKLNLSENDIQESANKLKSYNPRTSKREYEIKPEDIFNDIISNWGEKPDTNKVIGLFFESLRLKANIYEYSRELLKKCRNSGFKIACLTDLPNGMPDYIFKPAIENILPYFDLYVSSQICGVRKPNKGGICYIADAFEIREAEILFVGDEEKDFLTSLNAGCDFVYINDFLINEKTLHLLGRIPVEKSSGECKSSNHMYEHAIMSNFKQWEHFSEKETKQDERYVQFFGKR